MLKDKKIILENDVFHLVMTMGQRKNCESPWGIKTQTFRCCTLLLYHWSTETLWCQRGPVQSSYMTHILHTARISNVNGVMFVKMGSFELDKEIEKDFFFVLSLAWDKEKILNPHEELNLRPSDSVLQCSTTDPQRLYG